MVKAEDFLILRQRRSDTQGIILEGNDFKLNHYRFEMIPVNSEICARRFDSQIGGGMPAVSRVSVF